MFAFNACYSNLYSGRGHEARRGGTIAGVCRKRVSDHPSPSSPFPFCETGCHAFSFIHRACARVKTDTEDLGRQQD